AAECVDRVVELACHKSIPLLNRLPAFGYRLPENQPISTPEARSREPEAQLLDLRYQIRLFYVGEINFYSLAGRRAHLLARLVTGYAQVQHQPAVLKTLQPSFEVAVVAPRLPGRQFHSA